MIINLRKAEVSDVLCSHQHDISVTHVWLVMLLVFLFLHSCYLRGGSSQ